MMHGQSSIIHHVESYAGKQALKEFDDMAEFKAAAVMFEYRLHILNPNFIFATNKLGEYKGFATINFLNNFKTYGVLIP